MQIETSIVTMTKMEKLRHRIILHTALTADTEEMGAVAGIRSAEKAGELSWR